MTLGLINGEFVTRLGIVTFGRSTKYVTRRSAINHA